MFAVVTKTVRENDDLWEIQPMGLYECVNILVSNGHEYENALNMMEELRQSDGEDYIIVNNCCQIC